MKRPCRQAEEVLRLLAQGDLPQALADHVTSCTDCERARLLTLELRRLAPPEPDEDVALDARRIWVRAAAARCLARRQPVNSARLAPWSPLLGAGAAIVLVAALTALAPASLLAADEAVFTAGLGLILGSGLLLFLASGASMALAWDHI